MGWVLMMKRTGGRQALCTAGNGQVLDEDVGGRERMSDAGETVARAWACSNAKLYFPQH